MFGLSDDPWLVPKWMIKAIYPIDKMDLDAAFFTLPAAGVVVAQLDAAHLQLDAFDDQYPELVRRRDWLEPV
jgi:hypothetical protein